MSAKPCASVPVRCGARPSARRESGVNGVQKPESGALEILLVALDRRGADVVVGAGEEVADAARRHRPLERPVGPHLRVSDPDGPKPSSYTLLHLELHAEGAARRRRNGAVHADRPAAVEEGVVVGQCAGLQSAVCVAALEVERDCDRGGAGSHGGCEGDRGREHDGRPFCDRAAHAVVTRLSVRSKKSSARSRPMSRSGGVLGTGAANARSIASPSDSAEGSRTTCASPHSSSRRARRICSWLGPCRGTNTARRWKESTSHTVLYPGIATTQSATATWERSSGTVRWTATVRCSPRRASR